MFAFVTQWNVQCLNVQRKKRVATDSHGMTMAARSVTATIHARYA